MIYDDQGKMIRNAHFEAGLHSVNFETFSNGIYLLSTTDGSNIRTIKIVKTE